jgi:hypothetical protein
MIGRLVGRIGIRTENQINLKSENPINLKSDEQIEVSIVDGISSLVSNQFKTSNNELIIIELINIFRATVSSIPESSTNTQPFIFLFQVSFCKLFFFFFLFICFVVCLLTFD